ncbi:hypothetical protein SAMN04488239_104196 [Ruegeria marina]|uniref:Uncharacterized protein n=1 Tax=Ruegeria marina TaxID=639004 RepID=A0A1G6QQE0_9RHOB|nr:hypothetical protein SAMN04488239_104196 [Ruegeria marina]
MIAPEQVKYLNENGSHLVNISRCGLSVLGRLRRKPTEAIRVRGCDIMFRGPPSIRNLYAFAIPAESVFGGLGMRHCWR